MSGNTELDFFNVAIPVGMMSLVVFLRAVFWAKTLLFLIYVNDLIDHCGFYSDIYVFADDAKVFRHIMEPEDSDLSQYSLNELQN